MKIDKRLDNIFAIHVKLSHTNDEGYGRCYTCHKPLHYNYMDCGHFPKIPRENIQFRWNTELARPQCVECNRFKHGLAEPFRDRLISEIGLKAVTKMEINSLKPYQEWTYEDKKALFDKLKNECKEMLKNKMFTKTLP